MGGLNTSLFNGVPTFWGTQQFQDTGDQGQPTNDVTNALDNPAPLPRRVSTVNGGFAQQVFNPEGQFMGNGMGQTQTHQRQPLPQAQGYDAPDFPNLDSRTGGPYDLPPRRDLDQLTAYRPGGQPSGSQMGGGTGSAFMRVLLSGLQQGQNMTANPDRPAYTTWGEAPAGFQRNQSERAKLRNDQIRTQSEVDANEQQALERNTAAYGNVGRAYNAQNESPYRRRALYFQGNQRDTGADVNTSRAGLLDEQADAVQPMTSARLGVMGTQGTRNMAAADASEGSANRSNAGADSIRETTPHRIGLLDAQAESAESRGKTSGKNSDVADRRESRLARKDAMGALQAQVKAAQGEAAINLRALRSAQARGDDASVISESAANSQRKLHDLLDQYTQSIADTGEDVEGGTVFDSDVLGIHPSDSRLIDPSHPSARGLIPGAAPERMPLPEVPIEDGSAGKLIPAAPATAKAATPAKGRTVKTRDEAISYLKNKYGLSDEEAASKVDSLKK